MSTVLIVIVDASRGRYDHTQTFRGPTSSASPTLSNLQSKRNESYTEYAKQQTHVFSLLKPAMTPDSRSSTVHGELGQPRNDEQARRTLSPIISRSLPTIVVEHSPCLVRQEPPSRRCRSGGPRAASSGRSGGARARRMRRRWTARRARRCRP